MGTETMKHILESQQFNKAFIAQIFESTDRLRLDFQSPMLRYQLRKYLKGRLMYCLFYEPSTRTRFSFSSAAHHLGMTVFHTENAKQFSSAVKGESLEDTIRVLNGYYPDVIVLRHFETGSAECAARVSTASIINAGDGEGQHPTQAFLDLYTIQSELKRIDGLTVMIGGDLLRGRTARSLAYLLGKFSNIHIIFVSPPELRIGDDIKAYLNRHNTSFEEVDMMHELLPSVDVLYWTRIQTERPREGSLSGQSFAEYHIGLKEMSLLPHHAIVLHPLPRAGEIDSKIDTDYRAAYFRQSDNGMFLRMALLQDLFEK